MNTDPSLLEPLLCFAAIAENGTLSAAAISLGRSKAHVSRKLKFLEHRLSVTLFTRTTRMLALTEAGKELLPEARLLLQQYRQTQQRAAHLGQGIQGSFTITASPSVAAALIAPQLPALFRKFPALDVTVRVSTDNSDLLRDGADLAIRAKQVISDRLISETIGLAHEAFFASPNYLAKNGSPQSPEELSQHKLLLNPHSMKQKSIILTRKNDICRQKGPGSLKVDNFPILKEMAMAGHGIALLPSYVTREPLENSALVRVMPDWHGGDWPLYLIYSFIEPLPPKIQKVTSFLLPYMKTAMAPFKV